MVGVCIDKNGAMEKVTLKQEANTPAMKLSLQWWTLCQYWTIACREVLQLWIENEKNKKTNTYTQKNTKEKTKQNTGKAEEVEAR